MSFDSDDDFLSQLSEGVVDHPMRGQSIFNTTDLPQQVTIKKKNEVKISQRILDQMKGKVAEVDINTAQPR